MKERSSAPQPALSQKGFYTIVTNREIGNFDEPRQCQVIRQNGYDKESVAALKCLEELRCTPVGGWLKIQGYSGDGVNHVFLVQPQTGKMFTVAEAKNEYYQSLEEAAMQGSINLWRLITKCAKPGVHPRIRARR